MTRDERAKALNHLIDRYRVMLTRHCTCGDAECVTPRPAEANDFRVIGLTLMSTTGAALLALQQRDHATARAILQAAFDYSGTALAEALGSSMSDEDSQRAMTLFMATCSSQDERDLMLAAMKQRITDELVDTDLEIPTTAGLDADEIDRLYAEHAVERDA